MQTKHIEKEWQLLQKAEQSFLKQNMPVKTSGWQEKVSKFVPEKLERTLNDAFGKAFELIFDKGTGVIEKTYQKEKKQQNYQINEYASKVRGNRRALKAFGKEANASRGFNMAVSTVEGVGMGLLGMGIPDIPLFIGVLLKSIYEVALSYGFCYDTEEEQIFILKLIETALLHDNALAESNMELNLWLRAKAEETDACGEDVCGEAGEAVCAEEITAEKRAAGGRAFTTVTRSDQIRKTADALAAEMLYLKFVQGLPIVGVVGGVSDMVYQKKISDYAAMKYKRRFLEKKRIVK